MSRAEIVNESSMPIDFFEILFSYKKEMANQLAFIFGDQAITWLKLSEQVENCLAQLNEISLKGQRLNVVLKEDAQSVALLLACAIYKYSIVLIPSYYNKRHRLNFMHLFDSYCMLEAEDKNIKVTINKDALLNQAPTTNSVSLLTSGTTGEPKCVEHQWETLSRSIKTQARYKSKKWCSGFPLAHFSGMQLFLQSFLNGGCLIISKENTPSYAKEAIIKHKIDYLNCTPTYMRQLLMLSGNEWGDSIQHITLGGEVVDQHLLNSLKLKWPKTKVTHIYASSELGIVIKVKDGKAGFEESYIDNKKLKISDGELYVKASESYSMQSYLNESSIKDKWIATKDLVEVKLGRVYFLGRRDDVIGVGGVNLPKLVPC